MIRRLHSTRRAIALLLVLAANLSHAADAHACAVCFGDPDSDMARSAVAGVMFLGVVIVGLLMSVASLATCWAVRARRLTRHHDDCADSQPD